jgi:general secretion pathway protein N
MVQWSKIIGLVFLPGLILSAGRLAASQAASSATVDLLSDNIPRTVERVESGNLRPLRESPETAKLPLSGNPLWSVPLSVLTVTRERPLFSASRRPPPRAIAVAPIPQSVPAPPATPAPPEVPHLSLVGTVGNGDQSIAVFVDQSSPNVVRIKVGEAHLGWVLRVVRGRETALEKNDSTVLLAFPPPGAVPSIVSEQANSGGSGVLPGLGPVNQNRVPTIAPKIAPLPPPVSGRVPGL